MPTPLRVGMEAGDLEAVTAAFAPDAVLRSPIFEVPFRGREQIRELFSVLIEVFGELTYIVEIAGDQHTVLAFKTTIDQQEIEGVDLLSFNDQGEITEITVFIRPLPGIAKFLDVAGPRFARLKSKPRAAALRALGPPPSAMMRMVARLGPRLLGLKRPEK